MRNAEIAAALLRARDLYELDGADRFRVLAYREAARMIARVPGVDRGAGARRGPADRAPGSATRSRRRSSPCSTRARSRPRPSSRRSSRLAGRGHPAPGWARRPQGGSTTSPGSPARGSAGGGRAGALRDLRGSGRSSRRTCSPPSTKLDVEAGAAERRLLSDVLPAPRDLVAALREHPASRPGRARGLGAARAETCKDIDLIATADDPGAHRVLAEHPLIAEPARRATAPRADPQRRRVRPADRPARGPSATCSSTSPDRRSTT